MGPALFAGRTRCCGVSTSHGRQRGHVLWDGNPARERDERTSGAVGQHLQRSGWFWKGIVLCRKRWWKPSIETRTGIRTTNYQKMDPLEARIPESRGHAERIPESRDHSGTSNTQEPREKYTRTDPGTEGPFGTRTHRVQNTRSVTIDTGTGITHRTQNHPKTRITYFQE